MITGGKSWPWNIFSDVFQVIMGMSDKVPLIFAELWRHTFLYTPQHTKSYTKLRKIEVIIWIRNQDMLTNFFEIFRFALVFWDLEERLSIYNAKYKHVNRLFQRWPPGVLNSTKFPNNSKTKHFRPHVTIASWYNMNSSHSEKVTFKVKRPSDDVIEIWLTLDPKVTIYT